MGQQQFQNLQRAALGAIVHRRVALDTAPIHIGVQPQQMMGDAQVALVAGDHQARVPMPVGHLDVGAVLDQELDDLKVPVEAGRSQRCGIRARRAVHIGAVLDEHFGDAVVAGSGGAPQRWRALDRFAVNGDWSAELDNRLFYRKTKEQQQRVWGTHPIRTVRSRRVSCSANSRRNRSGRFVRPPRGALRRSSWPTPASRPRLVVARASSAENR